LTEHQFVCILHLKHSCDYRSSLDRRCSLRVSSEYAQAYCLYRIQAVELTGMDENAARELSNTCINCGNDVAQYCKTCTVNDTATE